MKRFECLQTIAPLIKNELFVTTAGGATAEWNAVRQSDGNIQVKTLGLCSSIGLGLALFLLGLLLVGVELTPQPKRLFLKQFFHKQ